MTAWYRENELGTIEQSAATEKHEYFNQTLDLSFGTLFPGRAEAEELEVETEAAVESVPTFISNRHDILEGVSTEEKSRLAEEEIHAHPAEWTESNSKEQPSVTENSFDDIFEGFHKYVLVMDYLCTVIKKFWRIAAAGAMPIPLAGWLTSAGFAQRKAICQVDHDHGGANLEFLLRNHAQKKANIPIATGRDLSIDEAAKPGRDPLYKNSPA
jgi:hypothetical protein